MPWKEWTIRGRRVLYELCDFSLDRFWSVINGLLFLFLSLLDLKTKTKPGVTITFFSEKLMIQGKFTKCVSLPSGLQPPTERPCLEMAWAEPEHGEGLSQWADGWKSPQTHWQHKSDSSVARYMTQQTPASGPMPIARQGLDISGLVIAYHSSLPPEESGRNMWAKMAGKSWWIWRLVNYRNMYVTLYAVNVLFWLLQASHLSSMAVQVKVLY